MGLDGAEWGWVSVLGLDGYWDGLGVAEAT